MQSPLDEDKLRWDSFLTDRQIKVLKLRRQGSSQQEVAEIMGTTRSNISIMEKRAHQNIARAKTTLRQWLAIQAPINLRIAAGTDVFEIPNKIFEAADKRDLHLPVTSLDIIDQLRREAPLLLRRRALPKDMDIYVTEEGVLLFQDINGD